MRRLCHHLFPIERLRQPESSTRAFVADASAFDRYPPNIDVRLKARSTNNMLSRSADARRIATRRRAQPLDRRCGRRHPRAPIVGHMGAKLGAIPCGLLWTAVDACEREAVVGQHSADSGGRLWTQRVDLRIRRLGVRVAPGARRRNPCSGGVSAHRKLRPSGRPEAVEPSSGAILHRSDDVVVR